MVVEMRKIKMKRELIGERELKENIKNEKG